MLQQILNTLPAIFTAALILIAAYFLGQFVSEEVTGILTSLGFSIFSVLGLPSPRRRPAPRRHLEHHNPDILRPPTERATVIQPERTGAAAVTTDTIRNSASSSWLASCCLLPSR